ncbi:hypothetical protein K501DRAFT_284675 [Backusella circina FSU 941]|nr:hypothetical protein K501DRAFT_284675 [Backusella circina FSU 941]
MASQEIKDLIRKTINDHSAELREISLEIHDNPELGNKEFKAAALLTKYLEEKGFKVSRGVVGLETAFIAEYSNGKEGRRVGFCSEYDALPGIGQGCGHNLIAITGVACALAVKACLEKNLMNGSVTLFGTPAEESTSGKINFVQAGEINRRVDFCTMLHPGNMSGVFGKCLALDSFLVEYFGRSSHAGASPFEGVNALDGLMQAFNNIAMLRQQTLPSNRIHGIIKHGGNSPNVIPDYASGFFYVRSVTRAQLVELKEKVEKCVLAGGKATGCQVKITWAEYGQIDDIFQNDYLGNTFIDYARAEGFTIFPREQEEQIVSGSSDMGNITYAVPGLHPGFEIGTKAPNHTREFTAAARTEYAHDRALASSVALAFTAADVFQDNELFDNVVARFKAGKE